MTKIIEIEACDQCPHVDRQKDYAVCRMVYPKKVVDLYDNPSWCPLPDKPKESLK
jgi:hypothetical protein